MAIFFGYSSQENKCYDSINKNSYISIDVTFQGNSLITRKLLKKIIFKSQPINLHFLNLIFQVKSSH